MRSVMRFFMISAVVRDHVDHHKKAPAKAGAFFLRGDGDGQNANCVRSAYWPVSSPFTSFSPWV